MSTRCTRSREEQDVDDDYDLSRLEISYWTHIIIIIITKKIIRLSEFVLLHTTLRIVHIYKLVQTNKFADSAAWSVAGRNRTAPVATLF